MEDFISSVGGRESPRKLARLSMMNPENFTGSTLRTSC